MKRILCITIAALAAGVSAYAQNINASVQVTNDYRASAAEAAKQEIPVSVPDSALKFDYNFDYSVFESPYMGAYEFTPYVVRVVPESQEYDGNRFFLKAGAGYTIHPVLQAVFATAPRKNFAMSIYQDLQGYYGDYWQVSKKDMRLIAGSLYKGYDFSEKFGVEGSLRTDALNFKWGVDYRGLYNSDSQLPTEYHSGGVRLNFSSTGKGKSYFLYDVDLSARYGLDRLEHYFEPVATSQHSYALDATFGPVIKGKYRILIDVDGRHDSYTGISAGRSTFLQLFPHGDLTFNKFRVRVGVKMSVAGGVRAFRIFPDAEIDYSLLDGGLDLFAGITGGQHMNSYSEFKEVYHRFNISYTENVNAVTEDKFDVYLGARGHVGSFFQYNVKAGYALYENAPLASVLLEPAFTSAVAFKDFSLMYANADLSWKSESLDITGGVNIRKTSLSDPVDCFDLPLFSGDISVVYNYMKRIYAGVSCEASTSRGKIMGYADLGVYAEYKFTKVFSFWAKGGNLLNMSVQRVPRYVEKGINFTAGITVNL